MSARRERQVGLIKITTESRAVGPDELIANGGALVQPPVLDRMRRWVQGIIEHVDAINNAPGGIHSEAVLEFARRCRRSAYQVRLFLGHVPPNAEAAAAYMDAAADLAEELWCLQANTNLEAPMRGAIRTSERGRAGAMERHAREQGKINTRNDRARCRAKVLRAANYTRAEILAKLARETGVKASTLVKIPQIRKELPRTRRNSSP